MSSEKNNKKIISIPFPALHYTSDVEFAKAERASGISYILMVLIENSATEKGKLRNILKSFNIPEDLHDIFAEELCNMVREKVVEMRSGIYDVKNILDWDADNFVFTTFGQELYEKGMFLSGEKTTKKIVTIYNPVTREISNKTNEVSSLTDLMKKVMEEKWQSIVEESKNEVSSWIRRNSVLCGVKKGSQITDIGVAEEKQMLLRDSGELTVLLSADGVSVGFSSDEEEDFFRTYYTTEDIQNILDTQCGTLKDSGGNPIPTEETRNFGIIEDFFFPNEIKKVLKQTNCDLLINRGRIIEKDLSQFSEKESENLFEAADEKSEIIFLQKDCGYKLIPTSVHSSIGLLQIIAKQKLSAEEFKNILIEIFNICNSRKLSKDSLQLLKYVSDCAKDKLYEKEYAENKMLYCGSEKEKIAVLNEMDPFFTKNDEWQKYTNEKINEIFESSLQKMTLEDVPYIKAVFAGLHNKVAEDRRDFCIKIIRKLKADYSIDVIMEAVADSNCKPEDVLSELNVVEVYMNAVLENTPISGKNKLAVTFENVRKSFNSLRSLLNLTSADAELNYAFDVDKFFAFYTDFSSNYEKIKKHSHLADKAYLVVEEYLPVFEQLQEDSIVRKTAENNPKILSKTEIDKFIEKGDYTKVISILYYKLQFFASKIVGKDTCRPVELIDNLFAMKIIDAYEKGDLHTFRMCRNGQEHPFADKVEYNHTDLKRWEEIILKIEESA